MFSAELRYSRGRVGTLLASIHSDTLSCYSDFIGVQANRGNILKKAVVITSFICLILGFQNCSQSSLSPEGNSSLNGGSSEKVESLESVSKVELVSHDASQWVLDVDSGRINYTSRTGVVSATRCLSEDDQSELKSIFENASICAKEVSDGVICTQQYSAGYAVLVSDADRVALGERLNGCGAGQKEICGVKGASFKAFLAHVANDIDSMVCQ